jgi:DsrE/DsrF-like family
MSSCSTDSCVVDSSSTRASALTPTATKVALLVLSDPKAGEEAFGRVFNALAAAYEFRQTGVEVSVIFQGTGTRWPALLSAPAHPLHALFEQVRNLIAGVSCGCADVFGAREGAVQSGFDLITDNAVPGTSGLPSLATLTAKGFRVLSF